MDVGRPCTPSCFARGRRTTRSVTTTSPNGTSAVGSCRRIGRGANNERRPRHDFPRKSPVSPLVRGCPAGAGGVAMSDRDETSWWSQDADGRPVKVTIIGGWEEPYEAEFAAWDRLPWWRKLLA